MNIRMATEEDAAAIAAIYRPFVLETPITFELDPPGEQEMRTRIRTTLASHAWLVAEEHGHIVGYAYGTSHATRAAYRWSVNVSVYLHESIHRRGFGRGLYVSLFEILTAQGYVMAYAGITLPNPKSVGVHEAMGFRPVGVYHRAGYKMNRWHDVGWWERPLSPATEPPRVTVSTSEIPHLSQHVSAGLVHLRPR